MQVREIRVYRRSLPVIGGPFRIATGDITALDSTLVQLISDDGLDGWGETCPVGTTYAPAHAAGARAALAEMLSGLIGCPAAPGPLNQCMDEQLAGHCYAKAAVDIAAHDLLGKALNRSVADLLGGARVSEVPAYYSLSIGDPEDTARIAGEKTAAGYRRLQIKIAGADLDTDVAAIRAVRERVGPAVGLAVDGNRSLSVQDAIHLSRECADIRFNFEQPCNTLDELANLRGRLAHPVHMDESGTDLDAVLTAIGRGLCDGFAMKVTRLGGLSPMATFRDICAVRRLPHTCDDAWGSDLAAAACVQIAATVAPRLLVGVWLAQPYIDGHDDLEHPVRVRNGRIAVPEGPGLGIRPNPEQFGPPVLSA